MLQLAEGGGLVTGDDPPVVMATMPASFLEQVSGGALGGDALELHDVAEAGAARCAQSS